MTDKELIAELREALRDLVVAVGAVFFSETPAQPVVGREGLKSALDRARRVLAK